MDGLTLAIDQGTHATRALVFDAQGRAIAQARQAVALQTHSHEAVEQDAAEIRASLHTVLAQVLADPALAGRAITAAGLATQRSSVVAWDRVTGQALAPVLSWQDRRSTALIAALATHETEIAQRTGLRLSPHYGAGKMRWLLDHIPAVAAAAQEGRLLLGPLASFLLFHLLEGRPTAVDHANAARTLLWNLRSRDWDPTLLALFGISRAALPQCRPIRADHGRLVSGRIPLRAVNGDQTAALYALGSPRTDTILVNIGTGAFALMPIDEPARRPAGLLAGIASSTAAEARYYLEGTVNGAGAALSWAAQRFALDGLEQLLPAWLDEIRIPSLFINTVGGLGAPWWRSGTEPRFERAGIAAPEAMVAVLESIVFLLQANITLLCKAHPVIDKIRVSGGLANLDALCQKLADLSGLTVQRPPQVEATARGIAWQAAGVSVDWPAAGTSSSFLPGDDPALRARYARFIDILESRT
ncbi:MAG: FGGY family carbohydrate kinase [Pseudomonadota bacterium]